MWYDSIVYIIEEVSAQNDQKHTMHWSIDMNTTCKLCSTVEVKNMQQYIDRIMQIIARARG